MSFADGPPAWFQAALAPARRRIRMKPFKADRRPSRRELCDSLLGIMRAGRAGTPSGRRFDAGAGDRARAFVYEAILQLSARRASWGTLSPADPGHC